MISDNENISVVFPMFYTMNMKSFQEQFSRYGYTQRIRSQFNLGKCLTVMKVFHFVVKVLAQTFSFYGISWECIKLNGKYLGV